MKKWTRNLCLFFKQYKKNQWKKFNYFNQVKCHTALYTLTNKQSNNNNNSRKIKIKMLDLFAR